MALTFCTAPVLDLNCFDDPARPLACAFNYPAVALTLGPARWGELRGFYLTLAQNRSSKVRRTLAASLGELARIIGPENAARDLLHVWWDAMRCDEDGDIRLKAIEALPLFVEALGEGRARDDIFSGLVKIWEEDWLSRSWRAREHLVQVLPDLAGSPSHPDCMHSLVLKALEDGFGTVRDAAIDVVRVDSLPSIFKSTLFTFFVTDHPHLCRSRYVGGGFRPSPPGRHLPGIFLLVSQAHDVRDLVR